jgi:methionyl-tRNA formyltransferase
MRALVPDALVVTGEAHRDEEVLARLRALEIDYLLSVHYPRLFPQPLLDVPRVGAVNLHPAWLPFNRGWHTPSWAILDGTPYGATLHWMVEEADAGDIAVRRELAVSPADTANSLYQKVLETELEVLREAIPLMASGTLPRVPQEPGGTRHRRRELEAARVLDGDASLPVRRTLDVLRALTTSVPAEAALVTIDGRRYRVRVEITPDE